MDTQIMLYSALISVTHPSNQMFQFLKQKRQLTTQDMQKFYQYVAKELDEISFTSQDIQSSKEMNLTAIAYILEKVIKLVGKQFITKEQYDKALQQKKEMEEKQKDVVNYKIKETRRIQNESSYGLGKQQSQQLSKSYMNKQTDKSQINKTQINRAQVSKSQVTKSQYNNEEKQQNNFITDDTQYLKYQLKYMENLYNKNQFLLKLINNRIGDLQVEVNRSINILKDIQQEYNQDTYLARSIDQLGKLNQFTELYDLDMIDKQYEEYLYQLEQRKIEIKQNVIEQKQKQKEEQEQQSEEIEYL